MRDQKFSIVKAFAIIFVVMSHAGAPAWLNNGLYIFHVPAFFICAGYFFHTKYLSDERTYVLHRVKGLYVPFVKWSLLFLVLHNLFFPLGLLSETYGNASGGVLHPYTWHQFCQNAWSIVSNMSGYDTFIGGAFWFFRAFFLASLAFLVLFKIIRKLRPESSDREAGWAILGTVFLLLLWKTTEGLNITGVAQGGYRELTGVLFMTAGFLLARYEAVSRLTWRIALPAAAVLVLAAAYFPSAMNYKADVWEFLSLPVPAVCGFLALCYVAAFICERAPKFLVNGLAYIGNHTLYIFVFHLLAFKVAGAVKVAWYGLPWQAIGGHPYVLQPENNAFFFLLYVLAGVALPLLWLEGWRKLSARCDFSIKTLLSLLMQLAVLLCKFAVRGGKAIWRGGAAVYRGFIESVKAVLAASSSKDE